MLETLHPILLHWGITTFALWVVSHMFKGIRFSSFASIVVSALLLGVANAVVKPLLILFTLPLTLLTLGLFLLVINALMIQLVSSLVQGFKVSGFWTALFASMVVSVLGVVLEGLLSAGTAPRALEMPHSGVWL